MSNFGVLDTRFRSALGRMAAAGRLAAYTAPVDPHLEVAAIMKKLDGGPALLFGKVDGYDIPVVGNLLSCQENCEAAFGIDFNGIREFVGRALGSPKPPVLVERAPAQQHVHTKDIDLARMLPALHHTRGGCRTLHHRRHRDRARSRHRHLQRLVPPAADHRSGPHRREARFRPASAVRVRARQEERRGPADRGLHRLRPRAALHRRHHGLADARARRRARGRGRACAAVRCRW